MFSAALRPSPRRILVIDGHPDSFHGHFVHALATCYADAAESAGHDVHRLSLAKLDVPLLASTEQWLCGEVPASLREAQQDFAWAQHLVFFYPLWLGDMPAMLKALLEQILRPGFAFRYRDGGFPEKALDGRSARVVVTMGMPAAIYRLWFRAHSLRSFGRNILAFVGIHPVRYTLLGGIDGANRHAERHLRAMERYGERAW